MPLASNSLTAYADLPPAIQQNLQNLTNAQAERLLYDWSVWARPKQRVPLGDWRIWMILAGRGFGKTRIGAETTRHKIETGQAGRVALVGQTAADVRDVMVEGESGILAVSPPWNEPKYEPSKRRLTWPNGATATAYSADEPRQLRGPQHDWAWADELASWSTAEAWDQLLFGLRLGDDPRAVVTTTPRPISVVRELLKDPTVVVTRGSTFENRANLAPAFFHSILKKYEGTRLGRQEIHAEVLDDIPGALWTRDMIPITHDEPELTRIVIGVDPAVTSGETSDLTGIIVAALTSDSERPYRVLADHSGRYTPERWATIVANLYDEHQADRVIAEVNNGGDLVTSVMRNVAPNLPVKAVRASRGKRVRAEPISTLYERGEVTHVPGLDLLEDQMVTFLPLTRDGSPDRVDALVWALTELSEGVGDVVFGFGFE